MWLNSKTIEMLRQGKVGVLPTDTLYGLVGSALSQKAVERIYQLKKRDPRKPMIILIADLKDLALFGINVREQTEKSLKKFWPGKVSIILPCSSEAPKERRRACSSKKFSYLHRGTKSLAFRLPKPSWLRGLLRETGPLVAPSANPENLLPAEDIEEAKKYFSIKVDFYVNKGKLTGLPSTLIELKGKKVIIKRQGAVKISSIC